MVITPPYYNKHYKAFKSWDFIKILPIVLGEIETRGFPNILDCSSVYNSVKDQFPEGVDKNHSKQSLSKSLTLAGYVRGSTRGKTWYYEGPIRKLDTRNLALPKPQIKIHTPTIFERVLNYFFPIDVEPVEVERIVPKPSKHSTHVKRRDISFCMTLAAF